MKFKTLILITLGSFILGCENTPSDNVPSAYIFDTSLKNSYENLNTTLNKKRIEIKFEPDTIVNNCIDYLSQLKSSELFDGVNNKIHQNEYLICEALDLLKSRNVSASNNNEDYGNKLSNRLTLTSYPSSINQESEAYGLTLQKLDPSHLKIGKHSVTRETDDWTYSLQVIASTDLNNDKVDDLIIWLHDKAKAGNYHSYTTLIVPLYNNDQPLSATPYNEWQP